MTKEELRQYGRLQLEIEQISGEISALESQVGGANFDGMPRSSHADADRIGQIVIKMNRLSEILHKKLSEAVDIRIEIEHIISKLPIEERVLMRYRYIECMQWEDICDVMNYSASVLHKKHRHALAMVK